MKQFNWKAITALREQIYTFFTVLYISYCIDYTQKHKNKKSLVGTKLFLYLLLARTYLSSHCTLSNSFIMIRTSYGAIQQAVLGHRRGKRATPKTRSSKIYKLLNNLCYIQRWSRDFIYQIT